MILDAREYLVHCRTASALDLSGLIAFAFKGLELPISHVQSHEDLGCASFLDLKVNKWECSEDWRNLQPEEPWIRIEFLRESELERAVKSGLVYYQPDLGFTPRFSILARLDGKLTKPVDHVVLGLFVISLAEVFQGSILCDQELCPTEELCGELEAHRLLVDELAKSYKNAKS